MFKKDHTVRAGRIAEDALGLFQNVHDSLNTANAILDEGMADDTAEHERLAQRIAQAQDQKAKNDNVAKKLADLFS